MKIDRLETHDRLLTFKKDQEFNIFKGAEDCLKQNPDSLFYQDRSPYIYLFAHPRTADDGVTKRMLWQPRLQKPKAQTNSYLFRAKSKTDIIEICWMIPPPEMWDQYKEGNITESEIVLWSIDQFLTNRKSLEAPEKDDLPEKRCKMILRELIDEVRRERESNKLLITNMMDFRV